MIPVEIIRYVVCSFLDVKDIATLARGCSEWKEMMDLEMCNYLLLRDFDVGVGDWKSYKTLFSRQIGYQDFNGVQVWKPRVGNHIYMSTKWTSNITKLIIKVENDHATLASTYGLELECVLFFRREYGRWECCSKNSESGFNKLESVQNYFDYAIVRHDWKI